MYIFLKISIKLSRGANPSCFIKNMLNHINGGDRTSIADIMDPLLQLDENHLEEVWAVAIIAKTCLSAKPSRHSSACYMLRALVSPLHVAAMAPLGLARCGGSYGAHHPRARASHLV
jgi:hypothetical protein